MEPEDAIVPLCLYNSDNGSLITLPKKIFRNGAEEYGCNPNGIIFYGINPDVRPKPIGADNICIKNSTDSTLSVSHMYDPFDVDQNCMRIMAWTEPIPYTTPLFITKKGDKLFISLDQNLTEGHTWNEVPILYVLFDPRDKVNRIGKNNTVFQVENNRPIFRFSNSYGRCLPDPNGISLGECIVLYNKNILNPEKDNHEATLLEYLQQTYGNYSKPKRRAEKILGIIGIIGIFLLTIILVRKWTRKASSSKVF